MKRVNDTYYACYAASQRVPDKKYPVQIIKRLAGHGAAMEAVYYTEMNFDYFERNFFCLPILSLCVTINSLQKRDSGGHTMQNHNIQQQNKIEKTIIKGTALRRYDR